jgi:hypothetical protein
VNHQTGAESRYPNTYTRPSILNDSLCVAAGKVEASAPGGAAQASATIFDLMVTGSRRSHSSLLVTLKALGCLLTKKEVACSGCQPAAAP